MEKLVSGTIPHGKSDTVKFIPEKDGIYLLGLSSCPCAYSVISSNAPVGLYSGDGLSLIYSVDRLYFGVPDGVEQFTLTATELSQEFCGYVYQWLRKLHI